MALLSYHIGEVFFHLDGDQTQEMLESAKTSLQKEMDTLKTEARDIERVLSELKVQLYAKFGTSINLESDWEIHVRLVYVPSLSYCTHYGYGTWRPFTEFLCWAGLWEAV